MLSFASERIDNEPEHGRGFASIKPLTLDALLSAELAEREMLLGQWLPYKGLALVFAPRGVGKTYFALEVAFAVASGGDFLNWRAPQPRKVLVIDGEMPGHSLQARWGGIVSNSKRKLPSADYLRVLAADLCEYGLPDLSTEQGQRELQPHIGDAELLVVDNLSTLARSGKENESESWASLQMWALRQRREGRSVLFVHHAGKGGEQRGTSRREDVMDTVVKLSRPEDYQPSQGCRFLVTFTKARSFAGSDAQPFEAKLTNGVWETSDAAKSRDERIVELGATKLSQRDIAREVGCAVGTVNGVLRRAVQCSTL